MPNRLLHVRPAATCSAEAGVNGIRSCNQTTATHVSGSTTTTLLTHAPKDKYRSPRNMASSNGAVQANRNTSPAGKGPGTDLQPHAGQTAGWCAVPVMRAQRERFPEWQ